MINNLDFKSGRIDYNEFHIDFNIPFSEQIDSLVEDLLQVKYTDGYLIDVGWCPEFDEKGEFVVQLIRNHNWETPVFKAQCRDREKLEKSLLMAIDRLEENDRD